jgi:hypothetical protein
MSSPKKGDLRLFVEIFGFFYHDVKYHDFFGTPILPPLKVSRLFGGPDIK